QVHEQAVGAPAALAVRDAQLSLTYAELDRWAQEVAGQLHGRGVGPEAVVGLLVPRSARSAVAALGVLRAGGAYLPLDPEHPAGRVAGSLADAGCGAVLTTPELAAA